MFFPDLPSEGDRKGRATSILSITLDFQFEDHAPMVVRVPNPYFIGHSQVARHDNEAMSHLEFRGVGIIDSGAVDPNQTLTLRTPSLYGMAVGRGFQPQWVRPESSPGFAHNPNQSKPGDAEVAMMNLDILPDLRGNLPVTVPIFAEFVNVQETFKSSHLVLERIESPLTKVQVIDAEYRLVLTANQVRRIYESFSVDLEANYKARRAGVAHTVEEAVAMGETFFVDEREILSVLDALPARNPRF